MQNELGEQDEQDEQDEQGEQDEQDEQDEQGEQDEQNERHGHTGVPSRQRMAKEALQEGAPQKKRCAKRSAAKEARPQKKRGSKPGPFVSDRAAASHPGGCAAEYDRDYVRFAYCASFGVLRHFLTVASVLANNGTTCSPFPPLLVKSGVLQNNKQASLLTKS